MIPAASTATPEFQRLYLRPILTLTLTLTLTPHPRRIRRRGEAFLMPLGLSDSVKRTSIPTLHLPAFPKCLVFTSFLNFMATSCPKTPEKDDNDALSRIKGDVIGDDSQRRFLEQLSVDFLCMLHETIFSAMCTRNPLTTDVLHGTILSAPRAADRVLRRRCTNYCSENRPGTDVTRHQL